MTDAEKIELLLAENEQQKQYIELLETSNLRVVRSMIAKVERLTERVTGTMYKLQGVKK